MEELRKVSDCRVMPSEKNCSLTISGKESEVVSIATYHAIHDHGHKDTPELKEEIRKHLTNEERKNAHPK